ncbi:MAG: zinc-dependent alcohol dehydrogenase family protein [Planctomycetales bacterium]|nr:zinc-dependent alcohol dehydrogenase family protein [Planctomycetales bacterium]
MVLETPGPVLEADRLRAADLPDPEPGPGEVRVRVSVCGACHTDLHLVEGEVPPARLPIVPGHQAVGRVDRCGPGASRFRPGDRVGIAWVRSACGRCERCRFGSENLCPEIRFTGRDADGGYADLAVVPEAFAYPLSGSLPDRLVAPLLCGGIVGYRAFRLAAASPGQRLAIYGFGASAHLVLQVALHRGCECWVATRGAAHQALARKLGARWVGSSADALPGPADAAILFAPAGDLVPAALEHLAPGGTLVLAGIALSDVPALVYARHLALERTVRSVAAATRRDGEEFLRLAAEIPVRAEVEVFPLGEANAVLRKMKERTLTAAAVLEVAG